MHSFLKAVIPVSYGPIPGWWTLTSPLVVAQAEAPLPAYARGNIIRKNC